MTDLESWASQASFNDPGTTTMQQSFSLSDGATKRITLDGAVVTVEREDGSRLVITTPGCGRVKRGEEKRK